MPQGSALTLPEQGPARVDALLDLRAAVARDALVSARALLDEDWTPELIPDALEDYRRFVVGLVDAGVDEALAAWRWSS